MSCHVILQLQFRTGRELCNRNCIYASLSRSQSQSQSQSHNYNHHSYSYFLQKPPPSFLDIVITASLSSSLGSLNPFSLFPQLHLQTPHPISHIVTAPSLPLLIPKFPISLITPLTPLTSNTLRTPPRLARQLLLRLPIPVRNQLVQQPAGLALVVAVFCRLVDLALQVGVGFFVGFVGGVICCFWVRCTLFV